MKSKWELRYIDGRMDKETKYRIYYDGNMMEEQCFTNKLSINNAHLTDLAEIFTPPEQQASVNMTILFCLQIRISSSLGLHLIEALMKIVHQIYFQVLDI